ncbi:MAG TPA: pirin-like C-terminal cupin domain-containing protein, partial [Flavisolibacter sp.]|nr:pirin-like C-terminal cupin domain-containing protein [Flavisolibacter sp.]
YVLSGKIESNGAIVDALHMGVFDHNSNLIQLSAKEDSQVLILAGEPLNEPVATYGPFVMNYPGELKQAVMDYETGKMGILSE